MLSTPAFSQSAHRALCAEPTDSGRTLASPLINNARAYLVISSGPGNDCDVLTLPVAQESVL